MRKTGRAPPSSSGKGWRFRLTAPLLHHRLGTALSMMNDQAGARAEFQTAVQNSPDYFPAQFSLGVLLQTEGKHAQAVDCFEAALKARPTYTEARLRLASSLRRTGRLKEALDQYEQAGTSAPDNAEARLGHAMVLSKLRRDREARDLLNQASADGGDLVFTHALARLLATSPDEKVRDGRRAMELVQQMLQRGRSLELGETYAMTLAELGQSPRSAGPAARPHCRGGAGGPDRGEGEAYRAPGVVRPRRSVPHPVDRRGDAMRVLLASAFAALVARPAEPAQAPGVTPMAIVSAETDAGEEH